MIPRELRVQHRAGVLAEVFGVMKRMRDEAGPLADAARSFAGRGGAAAPPRMPNINHVCMRMEGFNPDKVLKTLADFGVTPRGDATGPVGPLKSYVSMRMENRGGAKEGTPELYFTDPDGILLQLQDVSYCGGSGVFGEICRG